MRCNGLEGLSARLRLTATGRGRLQTLPEYSSWEESNQRQPKLFLHLLTLQTGEWHRTFR